MTDAERELVKWVWGDRGICRYAAIVPNSLGHGVEKYGDWRPMRAYADMKAGLAMLKLLLGERVWIERR